MSLHRRAAKRDDAEGAIVEALTQLGARVVRLSGKDMPDLLIGWKGHTYLAEVKTGRARLKPGQATFAQTWNGHPIAVLRTPDEAVSWLLGLAPHQVRLAAKRSTFSPLDWDQA